MMNVEVIIHMRRIVVIIVSYLPNDGFATGLWSSIHNTHFTVLFAVIIKVSRM
jgi:hypothetical protein